MSYDVDVCVCDACMYNREKGAVKELSHKCSRRLCMQPFHHIEPLVYVSRSHIHGYGLFARQYIPENTQICMYSGSLVTNVDSVDNGWVSGVKLLDGSGEVGGSPGRSRMIS